MRILVHQPRFSYYLGGGETVPLKQAEMLSKLGHEVQILTSKPPKYSDLYIEFKKNNPSIKIKEIELLEQSIYEEEPGKNWSRWDKEAILFGQACEGFYSNRPKFNLVVTHLLSDSLYVPRHYRNVLHLHGVPSTARDFDKIFLMRPDHFVSVSESVKEGWIALYPELSNKNIEVCYNGIDTDKFKDKGLERDIDLLYVGRMIPNKGIYQIIDALKILADRKVSFNKFVMVGRGPELENVTKKVSVLNLQNKVDFMQDLTNVELAELYSKSKIFLCPSYAKEGVLTTMLESASSGCAIVTADACGMPEFAKHKQNALLAIPEDSKSLSEMIEVLLTNKAERTNLINQAKEDIKKWDTKTTIKKLSEIYKSYE